jgi:hypothetical protein
MSISDGSGGHVHLV